MGDPGAESAPGVGSRARDREVGSEGGLTSPTPHADVNAVLQRFSSAVQAILGRRFVSLYLDGSLAIGGFDPDTSDIDFVVVTDGELPDEVVLALRQMHAEIAARDPAWGLQLEGSYIPRHALQGHDPQPGKHPYIDRGGATLEVLRHEGGYWVIHRHVLREHGVTLAGPEARTLIDPVGPAELRQAVLGILRGWWTPMLANPAHLQDAGYRCYAVLTMCRMLYTLEHATVVTKAAAARWALTTLDDRWRPLIEQAQAASRDPDLSETIELIRYTGDRSQAYA